MSVLYRIAGWEEHYEKSQSKRAKNHHWVAMPIKHDGGGFRRITIQPNATDLFAAWCLIVQVGAKCKTRGVLADQDGVPLDAEDLAIKTGFPVSVFDSAFIFFSGPKINWLLCSNIADAPSETENTPSETRFGTSEKQHSTVQDNTLQTEQTEEDRDFCTCMKLLKSDPSIENAINAVYASNDSFRTVNRIHIENSLKSQSDRDKWHPAIEGMAAKFAGVEMMFPNKSLLNWMAGKPEQNDGRCSI